jgi:hypothetical protein
MNFTGSIAALRSANANMSQGVNNCGYTQVIAAHGSFSGDTYLYANINASANCTSRFPDGTNTDSWGDYNSDVSAVLADTCHIDHTASGQDEVMYPHLYTCHLRRHLGDGDYFGMAALYGYR